MHVHFVEAKMERAWYPQLAAFSDVNIVLTYGSILDLNFLNPVMGISVLYVFY